MRRALPIVGLAALGLVAAGLVALLAVGPKRILAARGFVAANERLTTGMLVTGTPGRPVL